MEVQEELNSSSGLSPLYVFLDTNAVHSSFYSYKCGPVENLWELHRSGRVKIYVNDIVKREVLSHIDGEMRQLSKSAKKNLCENQAFRAMPWKDRHAIEESVLRIPEDARAYYEEFFEDVGMLPYDDMAVKALFDSYFSKTPPFEEKKEKKSEFPDAVIAYSVNKLATSNPSKVIHVVTEDKGLRSAIGESEQVAFHARIRDVLDCVSRSNEQYESIVRCVRSNIDEIADSIDAYLVDRDWDFLARNLDYMIEFDEVDLVEVKRVVLDQLLVERIDGDGGKADVRLACTASLYLSFFYTDHEREWYDREDHAYYGAETGEGSCDVFVPLAVGIKVDFVGEDVANWGCCVEDVSSFQEDIEVGSSSLKLYCDELYEPAFDTCPDCGQVIELDNYGGNGFCAACAPSH